MPWYTARDKTKPVPARVVMEMNKHLPACCSWLMSGASAIALASGADIRLSPAPVNRLDDESLQRGARNFVNYCLNCHSGEVHALQPAHRPRPDRRADQGQPDVRHATRSATR